MKILLTIIAVWFALSIITAGAWAAFFRHLGNREVVSEAERILREDSCIL